VESLCSIGCWYDIIEGLSPGRWEMYVYGRGKTSEKKWRDVIGVLVAPGAQIENPFDGQGIELIE
jgi:hypothetical protein